MSESSELSTMPPGVDMSVERSRPLPEGVNPIDQAMVDRAAREAVLKIENNPVASVDGREVVKIGGGALNPIEDLKNEIFGKGLAFSREWAASHDLPEKVIKMDPYTMVKQEILPEQVFSELVETGLSDPTAWNRVGMVIDEPKTSKEFRIATRNGLLRAIIVNIAMKTGRFDSVVSTMTGEYGLRPQAIAQWLVVDSDTRRALTKIFQIQGYEVPETVDRVGNVLYDPKIKTPLGVSLAFSDIDIDQVDIDKYLKEISDKLNICPGAVTVAYTIFRALGFPHGNNKYHDLYKHVKEGMFNLRPQKPEVAPFIEKIKDPLDTNPDKDKRISLADVLVRDGVLGLARSISNLGEAEIGRAWQEVELTLDVGDAVKDIRSGLGGGLNLSPVERRAAIMNLKELNTLLQKRKISQETYFALIDPERINKENSVTKMSLVESERDFWSGYFSGLVPGFLKAKKEKKIG